MKQRLLYAQKVARAHASLADLKDHLRKGDRDKPMCGRNRFDRLFQILLLFALCTPKAYSL